MKSIYECQKKVFVRHIMRQRIVKKIIKPKDCALAFGFPSSRDEFMLDRESKDKDLAKTITGGWFQYEVMFLKILNRVEPMLKKLGVKIICRLTLDDFGKLFKEKNTVIILFTHWMKEPNSTYFNRNDYVKFLEDHPDFMEYVGHSKELLEWLSRNSRSLKSIALQKLSNKKGDERTNIVMFKDNKVYADYDQIVCQHLKEIQVNTYLELLRNTNTSKVEFFDGLKGLYDIVERIPVDFYGVLDLNVCEVEDLVFALRKCRPDCHPIYKIEPIHKNEREREGVGVNPAFMLCFYLVLFKRLRSKDLTYFDALVDIVGEFKKCYQKILKQIGG